MLVIKRDGTKVPYEANKIANAIIKAMAETTKGIDEPLATDISNEIYEELKFSECEQITVEEIQDLVEEFLMGSDRKDVAKTYIIYRSNKNALRSALKDNVENYKLLNDAFISKYKHKPSPMNQLGNFVFYRTYSRWLPEERRREFWWETVRRAVEYNTSLAPTSREEAEELFDNIYNMKQFLAGRTLFTGGTEASRRFPMSNYNCAFIIANDFEAFEDLFTLLLIGAGVGLRTLKHDVEKLPLVRKNIKLIHKAYAPLSKRERKEYTAIDFEDDMAEVYIGDSKEGWRQALHFFFKMFYSNEYSKIKTLILNYDSVRPQGERLKTFGGHASGHVPLMKMFEKIYKIIIKNNTNKKKLKPIDCLDIANIIGGAVVSGGVRRTSEVILFDPDDEEIFTAKSNLYYQNDKGNWVTNEEILHRRMSNNTIQYYEKPEREQWHKHIVEMRRSGEPAFANMVAALKRRPDAEGGNPCMEIILRNRGMCNLTEVNVMGFVQDGKLNYFKLLRAQELSARAGYRTACVDFELHKWDLVNKEDMLIGCSLTGWQDMVNATNMSISEQEKLLSMLREAAHQAANRMADSLGRNRPKLYTTIKPSGTISQLPVVSNGVHYSHSPYYIRRVRISAHDPLAKLVQHLNYPVVPEVGQTWENCDTIVIEFPVQAPEGKTKNDVGALDQLEMYKMFMTHYVDHNASITVHVKNDEWDDVEQWVWDNWDDTIAISFLSIDENFYDLMPYEEINKEEYLKRVAILPPFNPALLKLFEKEETESDLDSECDSGACPVR